MDQSASQGLVFQEDAHRYTFDGLEIPGVNQIIRSAGHGALLAQYASEESRVRGKTVHKRILLDVLGVPWVELIPVALEGYLVAWGKFKRQTGFLPEPSLCEKPMVNRTLFFAGTPDLFGILNGRPVLIDIKTGASTTAALQTAAYVNLDDARVFLGRGRTPNRFDLRLFPNGDFRLRPHDNPNDWLLFVKCLRGYYV